LAALAAVVSWAGLVGVVVAGPVGGPAAAASTQGWTAPAVPLPVGASPEAEQLASIDGVDCPATGTCVAVGRYTSGSGPEGLIETLQDGVWVAVQAPEPPDAGTSGGGATLDGVTCVSSISCVAVGSAVDGAGSDEPLVDTLAGSTWTALTAPVPGNAAANPQASLSAITCVSTTSCVAIGSYVDAGGYDYGLIDTLSGTTWSATQAPEPPDAGTDADTNQSASLDAVACSATCVVAGSYQDTAGFSYGLIDTLSGTTWSATQAPEPPDAGTDADTNQSASLDAVACSATCVVAGSYQDTAGFSYGLIDTLSGTTWSATQAPEPPDAGTDAGGNQGASLTSVSCPSGGACVVVGAYGSGTGADALVETLTASGWMATQAPQPAGPGGVGYLSTVSCTSSTSCVAGGTYLASDAPSDAVAYGLIDTLTASGWSDVEAPEPDDAGTTAYGSQEAALTSASCVSGTCVLTGSFETASRSSLPLVSSYGAVVPAASGYQLVASDGGLFSFGDAPFYGSMGGTPLNQPVVGMAATPDGKGYWEVAADGGIFSFGDAQFYGSMGGIPLNKPIVGMAATPDGKGYWEVAADGGVFSFGDARFYGSTGALHLNRPIVGMASTPDGNGYWLVASDGGIFAFGDAQFSGSMGGQVLNRPIVGMAATPDGKGYWEVASDGGIFSFGDAQFYGSTGGLILNQPVVGMASTPDGNGYWLVAADGGIFAFGNAAFDGSTGGMHLNRPVVGIAIP